MTVQMLATHRGELSARLHRLPSPEPTYEKCTHPGEHNGTGGRNRRSDGHSAAEAIVTDQPVIQHVLEVIAARQLTAIE